LPLTPRGLLTPNGLIAQYGPGPVDVRLDQDGETVELLVRTDGGPIAIQVTRWMLEAIDEKLSRHLRCVTAEPRCF
jgi:hypothetical protein